MSDCQRCLIIAKKISLITYLGYVLQLEVTKSRLLFSLIFLPHVQGGTVGCTNGSNPLEDKGLCCAGSACYLHCVRGFHFGFCSFLPQSESMQGRDESVALNCPCEGMRVWMSKVILHPSSTPSGIGSKINGYRRWMDRFHIQPFM